MPKNAAPKKNGAPKKKARKKYAKPVLVKHGVLSIIEGD